MVKKVLNILVKGMVALLSVIILLILVSSLSPIYKWSAPQPFEGEKIYNPYQSDDSSTIKEWQRATFHTHTKVDKGINECPYYPDVVYDDYKALGYGIVAFTNHNALTIHPYSDTLDLHGYEHGYNLCKLHYNVFGAPEVLWFDPLLPIFDSQKQFKMNLLKRDSDFISFNHPDRTWGISSKTMERVSGYRLMEGDSGFGERDHGEGTHLKRWDEALSAGIYSHNILSDDNHNSKNPKKIARRSTMLNCSSPRYEDVKEALLKGDFYTLRTPPQIDGATLPKIEKIGIDGDTIFISLTDTADSIKFISQNGEVREKFCSVNGGRYIIQESDPYIRITSYYPNGVVLYSNAFARYSDGDSPYRELEHPVNWPLTVIYNIVIGFIVALISRFTYLFLKRK